MARNIKRGIDYFPLDVVMNDKVALIEAEFGMEGFSVVVKLYQKIYGELGYYCLWTKDVELLFARKIGINEQTLSKIICSCLQREIFDLNLYKKYKILTSYGIQSRYYEAIFRRKQINFFEEFLLLGFNQIPANVNIISVNGNINSLNDNKSTQSKEKESKVEESKQKETKQEESKVEERKQEKTKQNESKEEETKQNEIKQDKMKQEDSNAISKIDKNSNSQNLPEKYRIVIDCFNSMCINLQKVVCISEQQRKNIDQFLNLLSENNCKMPGFFYRVHNSDFLSGKNSKNWRASFDWLIKPDNFFKIIQGKYDNNSNSCENDNLKSYDINDLNIYNFENRF